MYIAYANVYKPKALRKILLYEKVNELVGLINRLLVDGPFFAHILFDKVVGLVLNRFCAGQRIAGHVTVAHLLGGDVVAQLQE